MSDFDIKALCETVEESKDAGYLQYLLNKTTAYPVVIARIREAVQDKFPPAELMYERGFENAPPFEGAERMVAQARVIPEDVWEDALAGRDDIPIPESGYGVVQLCDIGQQSVQGVPLNYDADTLRLARRAYALELVQRWILRALRVAAVSHKTVGKMQSENKMYRYR